MTRTQSTQTLSLETRTKKLFPALALALALASPAAIPATDAGACGPAPEGALSLHFSALGRHDRDALLAQWQPNAPVTSIDRRGTSTTVPIEKAADRWLKATQPVTFKVEDVNDKPDGDVVVHAKVMFEGVPFDDLVTVHFDRGRWKIVDKTSRELAPARPAAVAARSPY